MGKKKLTIRQASNVKARHQKLLDKANNNSASSDVKDINEDEILELDLSNEIKEGIVISRYGKQVDVEDIVTRNVLRCYIKRTVESITTGDNVLFKVDPQHNLGYVEVVKPRTSLLSRPDKYDGIKPVAANISKIVIVAAKQQNFSANIIDRYLVACAQAKITPIIVFNKIDILNDEEKNEVNKLAEIYRKIDYKVFMVSATLNIGIQELKNELANDLAILVGLSGMGKSSIINLIIPDANALTNEISAISKLGQHTTTNSKLYHLDTGGIIIDSPGVRGFSLWHLTDDEVTKSFKEFLPYLGHCRFRDCKHINDKGCAIIEAKENGDISQERLTSYYQIIESMHNDKPESYVAPGKRYGKH